MFLAKKTRK